MSVPTQKSRGSITLVALSLAVVIGISLGSYIALCSHAQHLSTRTIQLSRAKQLAESSMEEALWALNNNNWAVAPWTVPNVNDRELVLTDLSWGEGVTGVTNILVEKFDSSAPTITATGTVTVPGLGVFRRTLRATTKPAPLFANAMGVVDPHTNPTVASGTYAVKLSDDTLVDSWDSDYRGYAPLGPIVIPPAPALPPPNRDFSSTTFYPGTVPASFYISPPSAYSVASPSTYPDLSFNYAAVVAAPNITLNRAEIRGYVTTFGNPISVTTGVGGGKVLAPPAPPGTPVIPPGNIEQTRVGKSGFVPDFPVAPPGGSYDTTTLFSPINSGTLLLGTSGASTATQYFIGSTLRIQNPGTELVVQGPVVIRVDGDLELFLSAKIKILNTGRLEIFVNGNVLIGGISGSSAQFENDTNEPKKLALYSTNTGTRNFVYFSKKDFCGVIYSASNNSKVDFQTIPNPDPARHFYGAIVAKYNIEFQTGINTQFHYDTALQYLPKGWFKGVTTPFIIIQVTEL